MDLLQTEHVPFGVDPLVFGSTESKDDRLITVISRDIIFEVFQLCDGTNRQTDDLHDASCGNNVVRGLLGVYAGRLPSSRFFARAYSSPFWK